MISRLSLRQEQYEEMLRHVKEHAPLEACGLLAGRENRVESVIPVRNRAESPVRFVMDPYEQLEAFEQIDSQGLDLIGIFHSHPAGPDVPSFTDIEEAAYEVVHVIWSADSGRWTMRGFWIQDGQAGEVPLTIQDM